MVPWFQQDDFLWNPYPYYARLRAESPVFHDRDLGWVILTYHDVQALLKEKRLSSNVTSIFMHRVPDALRSLCKDLEENLADFLLFMDPPRHSVLKNAVGPFFTPAAIKVQEAWVREQTRALLPTVEGPWDLIHGLADALPPLVITRMLGLADAEPIRQWSHHLTAFLGAEHASVSEVVSAAQSARAGNRIFFELASSRRAEPRPDLASQLVAAGLTDRDIVSLAGVLVAAGHDTTASLIGNAVLALLEHPAEWERLTRDPTLLETVLEEVLRYDGPSQTAPRVVLEDFEYAGHQLRKGDVVHLFVASANHDPDRFERPDEFWPERPAGRHYAFGWGLHFCVGAFLARLQTRVVLEELLARFPGTTLAGRVYRYRRVAWRQIKALPVHLRR